MPFNPDYDGDNVVATTDFLAVLPLFGSTMVDTSFTCDYQGTDLEQFVGGLFDESLVLDSVYVEYLLVDTVTTFLPGCPDPVNIETVLERSYLFTNCLFSNQAEVDQVYGITSSLGYTRAFYFSFYSDGTYQIELADEEVGELTSFSSHASWHAVLSGGWTSIPPLPFPENWTINEDGIQVDWAPWSWVHNCISFRLIPYWHQAE